MRLIKEFVWCREYNINSIIINVTSDKCFTILYSYKIKKSKHMLEVLKFVQKYFKSKHTIWYQLCKWKTHNLLYVLGYKKNRTESCDMNEDVKFVHQCLYVVMSLFYIRF